MYTYYRNSSCSHHRSNGNIHAQKAKEKHKKLSKRRKGKESSDKCILINLHVYNLSGIACVVRVLPTLHTFSHGFVFNNLHC